MIIKWNLTIPPLTGDTVRRAYVYLPEAAKADPDARFPVLYMFDGHNVFFDSDATYGKSWGMGEYLDRTGTPLIVAAVECDHSPAGGRLSEYSPFDCDAFPEFGTLPGRGRETMEWFAGTFKPCIDARFPTLPDRLHTYIAGSSMGGLMSLYAVTVYNRVFSRAAALSPSVWFAADRLDEMLRAAPLERDTVVYMDCGSRELRSPAMVRQFHRVAGALLDRGVYVTARVVPHGEHCEASWEKQIPFFLPALLYGE